MKTTKLTIGQISKMAVMPEYMVGYRLRAMGIEGERIHASLYLYDEEVVAKVKAWQSKSKAGRPSTRRR